MHMQLMNTVVDNSQDRPVDLVKLWEQACFLRELGTLMEADGEGMFAYAYATAHVHLQTKEKLSIAVRDEKIGLITKPKKPDEEDKDREHVPIVVIDHARWGGDTYLHVAPFLDSPDIKARRRWVKASDVILGVEDIADVSNKLQNVEPVTEPDAHEEPVVREPKERPVVVREVRRPTLASRGALMDDTGQIFFTQTYEEELNVMVVDLQKKQELLLKSAVVVPSLSKLSTAVNPTQPAEAVDIDIDFLIESHMYSNDAVPGVLFGRTVKMVSNDGNALNALLLGRKQTDGLVGLMHDILFTHENDGKYTEEIIRVVNEAIDELLGGKCRQNIIMEMATIHMILQALMHRNTRFQEKTRVTRCVTEYNRRMEELGDTDQVVYRRDIDAIVEYVKGNVQDWNPLTARNFYSDKAPRYKDVPVFQKTLSEGIESLITQASKGWTYQETKIFDTLRVLKYVFGAWTDGFITEGESGEEDVDTSDLIFERYPSVELRAQYEGIDKMKDKLIKYTLITIAVIMTILYFRGCINEGKELAKNDKIWSHKEAMYQNNESTRIREINELGEEVVRQKTLNVTKDSELAEALIENKRLKKVSQEVKVKTITKIEKV